MRRRSLWRRRSPRLRAPLLHAPVHDARGRSSVGLPLRRWRCGSLQICAAGPQLSRAAGPQLLPGDGRRPWRSSGAGPRAASVEASSSGRGGRAGARGEQGRLTVDSAPAAWRSSGGGAGAAATRELRLPSTGATTRGVGGQRHVVGPALANVGPGSR
jgi:hypothetical protein